MGAGPPWWCTSTHRPSCFSNTFVAIVLQASHSQLPHLQSLVGSCCVLQPAGMELRRLPKDRYIAIQCTISLWAGTCTAQGSMSGLRYAAMWCAHFERAVKHTPPSAVPGLHDLCAGHECSAIPRIDADVLYIDVHWLPSQHQLPALQHLRRNASMTPAVSLQLLTSRSTVFRQHAYMHASTHHPLTAQVCSLHRS